MFDFSHDFFRPMWRRVLIVVFCVGWAVFEYTNQATFWAVIFLGFGGLAFWKLFLDQENVKKLNEPDEN